MAKSKEKLEQEANDAAVIEMGAVNGLAALGVGGKEGDEDHLKKVKTLLEKLYGIQPEEVECGVVLFKLHNKNIKGMEMKGGTVGTLHEVELLDLILAARVASQKAAIEQQFLNQGKSDA